MSNYAATVASESHPETSPEKPITISTSTNVLLTMRLHINDSQLGTHIHLRTTDASPSYSDTRNDVLRLNHQCDILEDCLAREIPHGLW